MPTVSIGLPVYNGEKFLAQALDSFSNQTFSDFEVVVSDNGSTDLTQCIAREYASRDPRIRYVRSERNHGATWNFNRVFELSSGKYFRWAAHDDTIEPEYLERCVDVLDRRPEVVLCQAAVRIINAEGEVGDDFVRGRVPSSAAEPHVRFGGFVLRAERCYEVFGLMRSEALRTIPPLGDYGHADGVLLSRLSLLGQIVELPEHLQNMRVHDEQSMYVYGCYNNSIDYQRWSEWYNPDRVGAHTLPHWRMLWEFARTVVVTPGISLWTRVRSVPPIFRWASFYHRRLGSEALRGMKSRAVGRWESTIR